MSTEAAVCAVHAGQPAYTTCARCGNFACSYCLGDRDLCGACVARDEGGVISWERKDLSLPVRFWRTTRDVITRPVHALTEQRSTASGAALTYTLVASAIPAFAALLCCAPFAALGLAMRPHVGPDDNRSFFVGAVGVVVLFALAPVGALAAALLRSVVFHVGARALGGTGGFDISLRACAYMTAFLYVDLGGALLAWIPILGVVVSILVLAVDFVWSGRTLTAIARAQHGIPEGRAAVAGWVPPTLYLLFALTLLALYTAGTLSTGTAPDSYD